MDRQADLCWGQRYVWLNHHQLPPPARRELNLTMSLEPPPGSSVESIRLTLDLLVRRHEGLRTTLPVGAGAPHQRVHPARPLEVTTLDVGDRSPAEVNRLVNAVTAAPFDLDTDWPMRACLVLAGAVVRRLVLVVHHTATDDWCLETLRREAHEVHESILAGRPARLPSVRHQPVDLARTEADAQEIHARSLAQWQHVLAQAPGDLFAARRRPTDHEATALRASLSSPLTREAAGQLATRHGVWPSIVYIAAFTALLAGYTGAPTVWFTTYAGNRDSSGPAEVLTCLFQPVPVLVECRDDPTFAELVRRTAKACGEALESSRGRYDEFVDALSRSSTERGQPIRFPAVVNYLRYPDKTRGGTRTIVNWNHPPDEGSVLDDLYLRVSEWSDCAVATLTARSAVMAPEQVEMFLRGFEALLGTQVESAHELTVSDIARLVGLDTGPLAYRTVDPDRVAECLAGYPGVRTARVFAGPDGRLTAYLAVADAAVGPGHLRTHLLARGYDIPQVACPDWFVLCDGEPTDRGRVEAWAALPVMAAGDGRQPPAAPPVTAAERALDEAVRAVNEIDGFGMAHSYVTAGGRVLNIPAVQRFLDNRGWAGPSLYEMASARPLAEIAARLTRTDQPPDATEHPHDG